MLSIDDDWEKYLESTYNNEIIKKDNGIIQDEGEPTKIPKCSDIYISTKTKISYLTYPVDLKDVFWKIPILEYHIPQVGILKKQMKMNSTTQHDLDIINQKLESEKCIDQNIINSINNPTGRIKFRDIRKISIGLSKKDILSYKCKKKSAFYNCFVLVLRVVYNGIFKEVNVKVFNTGKLEIPGIQKDDLLDIALDLLIKILSPIADIPDLRYNPLLTENVLINSNFNCGFYIDRDKLFNLLRFRYKINSCYDPCSYPGIQCAFYYNLLSQDNDGRQVDRIILDDIGEDLDKKGNLKHIIKIAFMIFRTGSVLIVGKCSEKVLVYIYEFIRKILQDEFHEIATSIILSSDIKPKKIIKKKVISVFKLKQEAILEAILE